MNMTTVLFFIAVHIIPADISSFAIATPNGNIDYTRIEDQGWKAVKAQRSLGIWSLDGTKLSVDKNGAKKVTDLRNSLVLPPDLDWKTVDSIKFSNLPFDIKRGFNSATVNIAETGFEKMKFKISWTPAKQPSPKE